MKNDEQLVSKKELFEKIKQVEPLIHKLFDLDLVNHFYINNLINYSHTKSLINLQELNIKACLKCNKIWDDITKPHNAHNMSKEIMLGSFVYKRNKVISINSSRPFTNLRNYKLSHINEIPKDIDHYLEDIDSASTFGGICFDCDQVYNYAFEYNKNLDFNNDIHIKLLVERASFFKYYRENLTTSIINKLLNIKKTRKCQESTWSNYIKLAKNIKETNIIKNRNLFFNYEMIIKTENNFSFLKKKLNPEKGILCSDVVYDINLDSFIFLNVFNCKKEEYFIISSKKELSEQHLNSNYINFISNIEQKIRNSRNDILLKDIIVKSKNIFESSSVNSAEFINSCFINEQLCLNFLNETYLFDIKEFALFFNINFYRISLIKNHKISKKFHDKTTPFISHDLNNHAILHIMFRDNMSVLNINLRVLFNSLSWYKYEKISKKTKRKKHKNVTVLPHNVNCLFYIKEDKMK